MWKRIKAWLLEKCPMVTVRFLVIGTWPWPEISILEIESESFIGSAFHFHITDSGTGMDFLYIPSLWRFFWLPRYRRRKVAHTS